MDPTSWAASDNSLRGVGNRKTDCPNRTRFGSLSLISDNEASISGSILSSSQGYVTRFNPLTPTAPILAWEICPPSAVETAVMVSPGFERAFSAAMLDTVPEVD